MPLECTYGPMRATIGMGLLCSSPETSKLRLVQSKRLFSASRLIVLRHLDAAFDEALVVLFAGVFEDGPIGTQCEGTLVAPRLCVDLGIVNDHFIGDMS